MLAIINYRSESPSRRAIRVATAPAAPAGALAPGRRPRAVRDATYIGSVNPEHQHRTAQATRRQLGYPLLNLVPRRRYIRTVSPSAA